MFNKITTFTVNVHEMGGQEKLSIFVALLWRVKHYRGHFSQQTSHTLLICTLGPARELCSAGSVLRTQPGQLFIKPQMLLCDIHKPSRSDTSVHIFVFVLARYGRKCLFCRSSAPWGCGATTPPWPNGFGLIFLLLLLTTAGYPFGDVLFLWLGKRGYSLEFWVNLMSIKFKHG